MNRYFSHFIIIILSAISFVNSAESTGIVAGVIKDISISKDVKDANKALFVMTVEEKYKEDSENLGGEIMPDFDQNKITVIINNPKKGSKEASLSLIFDGIGIFENKIEPKMTVDFLKQVVGKDKSGSYLNQNVMYTEKGRDLKSAEFTISATSKILYQFIDIDREQNGLLIIKFAIVKIDETAPKDIKTTVVVDITDVDSPVGDVIGLTNKKDARIIEQLSAKKPESFVTVLYPLDHIAPNNAMSIVKNKLSLLGKISADVDNPALLITDRCDYVISMVQALSLIDRPISQVEIEVKILEVSWGKGERIGFNWGGVSSSGTGGFFSGALKTGLASSSVSSAASLMIGRMDGNKIKFLNSQIDLLAKKKKISLLASPRLKVVNNSKAEFHAGEQIPYFKSNKNSYEQFSDSKTLDSGLRKLAPGTYDSRTINRDMSNSNTKEDDYIDVGVKLTVTPRITHGGDIILELTPEVSEITGWREGSDRPIISTRKITTTVKVKDRDTVLIAGLFKEFENITKSGIPGLKELPAVGKLFRSQSINKDKKEVIFLLKISIVK